MSGLKSVGRNRPSEGKSRSIDSLIEGSENMKRVNFELPERLHTKLKTYAATSGKSIKDILTEYVERLP